MTTTIGIDIAKNVFHIHGVDATGTPTVLRKLRRVQVLAAIIHEPEFGAAELCAA